MSRRCLSTAAGSFMARAKAENDPSVLLGPFTSAGRFDACLERAGMHCLAIGGGKVICDLTVNDELSNNYGERRTRPPPQHRFALPQRHRQQPTASNRQLRRRAARWCHLDHRRRGICARLSAPLPFCALHACTFARPQPRMRTQAHTHTSAQVGTLALLSKDPSRAGVSIEMNQSFCAAAKARGPGSIPADSHTARSRSPCHTSVGPAPPRPRGAGGRAHRALRLGAEVRHAARMQNAQLHYVGALLLWGALLFRSALVRMHRGVHYYG